MPDPSSNSGATANAGFAWLVAVACGAAALWQYASKPVAPEKDSTPAPACASCAGCSGGVVPPGPTPVPPAPQTPVQQTAKFYRDSLASDYAVLAQQAKAGTVTKDNLIPAIEKQRSASSKAYADALKAAPDLAAALQQASETFGGK